MEGIMAKHRARGHPTFGPGVMFLLLTLRMGRQSSDLVWLLLV